METISSQWAQHLVELLKPTARSETRGNSLTNPRDMYDIMFVIVGRNRR